VITDDVSVFKAFRPPQKTP